MCTGLPFVIRLHNNVTNRISKTANNTSKDRFQINFLACNVLHKFFLEYFQEVLKNNNSSKENHKINKIFSHLRVTESTF